MEPRDLWIVADAYAVRQAFTNVIENAIKYTRKGGVDVRLWSDGGSSATVSVRDTGIGIAADFLPRIFDEFAQEQGGYGRPFEGSGLGLALAKKFVEASGGRISLESAKDVGSIFRLSFPLAPESSDEPAREPTVAEPPREAAAPRLAPTLLVEDDPPTQEFMRHACAGHVDFHVAASAEEARAVLARTPVELILMDLSLPGETDGLELTRELREHPHWRTVPIVVLTGRAHDRDRERALAAGCDTYLSKPIDTDELLDTIARVLGRRTLT